jgi:uncharacterized protein (DUF1800 family)
MRVGLHQASALAVSACFVLLGACGGGGGGSSGNVANPPPPPPVSNPPLTKAQAYAFLNRTTFGATTAEAQRLIALGDSTNADARWIDEQLAKPASTQLAYVQAAVPNPIPPGFNIGSLNGYRVDVWFQNAVRSDDQLRQRVAWALSQIMVVSQVSLNNYPFGLADYYDMLARNAFGDFRKLIEDVTLHPMMGVYLSMLGNQKPNAALNIRPDENYARELMQLFTVGLVQLDPDGTVKRDAQNQPLPTYEQSVIEGFAHVFTGWKWACAQGSPANCNFNSTRATGANQILPMQAFADQHDTGAKKMLSYPGAAKTTIPAGQTPAQDLKDALDNIVGHPNVAPFLSKQLIQKLVTSNPSRQYVQRISQVFENDGSGRRGNLGAVVKAILLDSEARSGTGASAGKLKEPLLRVTQLWREYNGRAASGRYNVQNPSVVLGQGPLQAPSVFNFFSPFYAPPGEIADQGLVAPEMQIATEFLNTQLTNFLFVQAFCYTTTPVTGCPATFPDSVRQDLVIIDVSAEVALANDSTALVNRIADRLLGAQISPTLAAQAKSMTDLGPTSLPGLRVAESLWLIASSPEFAAQR